MATFKAEIQNRRADGTYQVRIRVTHNRVVRRISTHLFVTAADLTRGLKIKNTFIIEKYNALISKCRDACNNIDNIKTLSADDLADRLKIHLQGGERFSLDFIGYMKTKATGMKKSTGDTYINAANALLRFKPNGVDVSVINAQFLREFESFLENEPSQRGNNRKIDNKAIPLKGGRAVSKYLGCIRATHNRAKTEFNDEDRALIRIPWSPFKNFKIRPQPRTRKRGLTPEVMQAIIDTPYEPGGWSRFNLAKDCFILSFALIGMNGIDMYNAKPVKRRTLTYNRAKTTDRREDKAEMRVRLESCIDRLLEKYRDPKGERLFNFYRHYSNPLTFNRAVNIGLKRIGEILDIEGLEFYAARHSWATIARSSDAGIDKTTVHEALNHVSGDLAITDIYIDRDWSVIWNANKKVLSLFDWSAVGYDVL
jgi:integrase